MDIPLEQVIIILQRIATAPNMDDSEHSDRVSHIALAIGKQLNGGQRLNAEKLLLLDYAARVHDLGQVDVDDYIKSKRGGLRKSQAASMRTHPTTGYDFVKEILPYEIGSTILYHHEHWDGSGYPEGLKELDIPLFARIVCIADVWDGIISKRAYHPGRTVGAALEEMNKSIMWFDPKLFAIFLYLLKENNGRF